MGGPFLDPAERSPFISKRSKTNHPAGLKTAALDPEGCETKPTQRWLNAADSLANDERSRSDRTDMHTKK